MTLDTVTPLLHERQGRQTLDPPTAGSSTGTEDVRARHRAPSPGVDLPCLPVQHHPGCGVPRVRSPGSSGTAAAAAAAAAARLVAHRPPALALASLSATVRHASWRTPNTAAAEKRSKTRRKKWVGAWSRRRRRYAVVTVVAVAADHRCITRWSWSPWQSSHCLPLERPLWYPDRRTTSLPFVIDQCGSSHQ